MCIRDRFNVLTGTNQFVGNWPGVTVEKKEGKYKGDKEVKITDLPGIYSLSPYTLEEVVAREFLLNEKVDVTVSYTHLVVDEADDEDGVLVRSASMHEYTMNPNLKAIARAGAGVNNIPLDKCSEKGIVVFNTPGANANAVKELVLCGLLLSSRKVVEGIDWVKTLKGDENVGKVIEKGKSQFVGPELDGKKLGIIGLGAIGVNVANAAIKLGMEVYGFDPYISVNAAWGMSKWVKNAQNMETIFSECDYITLHAPSTKETKGIINKDTIALMKDGVRILNFARADLVVSQDILDGVKEGKIAKYVTDFATPDLVDIENIIVMPHLGASTPESEDNCARMAVKMCIRDRIVSDEIIIFFIIFPPLSKFIIHYFMYNE